MTREDLLFVLSLVWFVALFGAAAWMIIAG